MTAAALRHARPFSSRVPIALLALATLAVPLVTAPRLPLVRQASGAPAAPGARPLPLEFEQNQGQADRRVRFLASDPGGTVFLTASQMVLALSGGSRSAGTRAPAPSARYSSPPAPSQSQAVVRMAWYGSAPAPEIVGVGSLATVHNYMVGDQTHWHLGVPSFARVAYRNVYAGIDLVFHGETGAAEYDFIVAAGASPDVIALGFAGQRSLHLDANGDLLLETSAGVLTQHRPVAYQDINGARHDIPSRFVLGRNGRVTFDVGGYDTTRPLVIDPVIAYSTFVGGSGSNGSDNVVGAAVDASGNAYLVGATQSTDFPATSLIGPRNSSNAFVLKLNPSGSAVVWSTVFGGSDTQGDEAAAVALDGTGHVWVTGFTHSIDFPTTANAFQRTRTCATTPCLDTNVFVSEFRSSGNKLLYSTYLGGHGGLTGGDVRSDEGWSIGVDALGKVYVTGNTSSPDFPTTSGAFQRTNSGSSFATKLDPAKTGAASLVYSTFLGPTGVTSMAVDAAGEVWFGGWTSATNYPVTPGAYQTANLSTQCGSDCGDATLSKLNAAGSALLYSTYLGGSKASPIGSVALGPSGRIYAAGRTEAGDFPTTSGAFSRIFHGGSSSGLMDDGFLSVIAPNGQGAADLAYSTYIGGTGDDDERGVAVDGSGNAYVLGETKSSDWPLLNAIQGVWGGQNLDFQYNTDASVAELRPAGGGASDLVFSTYFGGTGSEAASALVLGPHGTIFVAGSTQVPATPAGALPVPLPTSRGALRQSWNPTGALSTGFVAKLDLSGTTGLLAVAARNGTALSKSDAGGYTGLGSLVITGAPAVVAVPVSGGLPTPLYIGVGSNHALYVRSATKGWQALSSTAQSCIDSPGATVTTGGGVSTLTVACQGSDHGLWFAQGGVSAGSLPTVSGWQALGGTLSAGPAVAQVAGVLTFMVVGSDGSVFSRTPSSTYAATGWVCSAHPALASYRNNAYFACHGSDGALWYSVNPGSGWTQLQSAGGSIVDGPAIAATPAEVVIYVEGADHAVYQTTISPGGGPATPYVSDGGSIQFGTGAATLTP